MASGLILLTIGLPWLGALCVWLRGKKARLTAGPIAVVFAAAAALASLALVPFASDEVALRIPVGGAFGDFTFTPDGMSVLLACIATIIGGLAVIFSLDYMRHEEQQARYYALVLLFIGAMAGLVLTASLLLLFFFWELVAFCSYALISFHNDDPKAVAGGIKALVITQIGGVGLLIAVLTAYANTGSYQFTALIASAPGLPREALAVIAFGCLIAAAAKSAQVPFHTWLPDAMEAPTPVSALIHAATMVNAGIYLLARFYPVFEPVPGWTAVVMAIGILSMLLAGVMALVANDLKRVLAYSTISQLGLMVAAVGMGAIVASQFHLLNHAVFKALLFLAAGAVIHLTGTRDLGRMGGLGNKMPYVRNAFIVGALALAGVPILNGFWSKELILEAGSTETAWVNLGLMLAGVGLTALYAMRVTWLVFFAPSRQTLAIVPPNGHGRENGEASEIHDAPRAMRIALGVLVVGAFTTWLLIGKLSELLALTLPYQHLDVLTVPEMVVEIFSAPLTYVALAVLALGFGVWWQRERLSSVSARLDWIRRLAEDSFGFEWVNTQVVRVAVQFASVLRRTQTGQLNWNAVGIVGGLIVVLGVLLMRR